MSKKEKSGKKISKNVGNEDVKRDQKLQAIVLADTFKGYFNPITWNTSTMLLPLVNVPMIEYTIEFLAQNGVEEIFIFCAFDAEIIETYVKGSKWPNLVSVRCITCASCMSAGDALRELDMMGEVRSDPFVLISGDVVSNMDLKAAIKYHKDRCKDDSSAVMTVCMKKMQQLAKVRPVRDDLVVAMDRQTSQLLLFNDTLSNPNVAIPKEILAEHSTISLFTDLLDCHIDICSPALLLQFSDNFDYQDIRRHFIQNEVVNYDLGVHIYGYILQNKEYAARVCDPRTYHAVCRDIVNRWVTPVVPEYQFGGTISSTFEHTLLPNSPTPTQPQTLCQHHASHPMGGYTHSRHNVYKQTNVKVDRSATLGVSLVIGSDTVLKEKVFLTKSIVGSRCLLGKNANIQESHLWSDVIVEANVTVNRAIICSNVVLREGCSVGRGCIIAGGVVIGMNVVVPEYTRISLIQQWDEGIMDVEDVEVANQAHKPFDVDVVGQDGKGYVWEYRDNEVYEDDENADEDMAPVDTEYLDAVKASSIGCIEEERIRRFRWMQFQFPEVSGEEEEFPVYDSNSSWIDAGYAEKVNVDASPVVHPPSPGPLGAGGPNASPGPGASPAGAPPALPAEVEATFAEEVYEQVYTGYYHMPAHFTALQQQQQINNILVEIVSFKMAKKKEFFHCIDAAFPALVRSVVNRCREQTKETGDNIPLIVRSLKVCFNSSDGFPMGWGYLLLKGLLHSVADQLATIECVEAICLEPSDMNEVLYPIFRLILQCLFDEELLSEEALHQWIALRRTNSISPTGRSDEDHHTHSTIPSDEVRVRLFQEVQVTAFVAWLEEEESSEEESEEESDED